MIVDQTGHYECAFQIYPPGLFILVSAGIITGVHNPVTLQGDGRDKGL